MKKFLSLCVLVVCLLCGLVLISSLRGVSAEGETMARTQELTGRVARLREENEKLQEQASSLQKRIEEYENLQSGSDDLWNAMNKELESARREAGLTDVAGAGIVLEMRHRIVNGAPIKPVSDEDLLLLVNELNAAGALAIEINGERVVATTEIRNAGNHISINTNTYNMPFTIKAIGQQEALQAAMNLYGGVVYGLNDFFDIRIIKESAISIAAYRGVRSLQWPETTQGAQGP